MDYVIKNHKGVYIKLNENGAAVTCPEHEKGIFEYSKAENILKSLKKSLKKLKFKVEPISEIPSKESKEVIQVIKETVIQGNNYELSENVSRWVDKFGACYDTLNEAKQILGDLITDLENFDKEMMDILHSIELEPPKDLYNGWKIYKKIKENRKRRRISKDEILIITNVLERIDPSCLNREQVQKAIDGLFKRKYTFRIIEEETENVM